VDLLRRGALVALLLAIPVLLALASQQLAERPAAPRLKQTEPLHVTVQPSTPAPAATPEPTATPTTPPAAAPSRDAPRNEVTRVPAPGDDDRGDDDDDDRGDDDDDGGDD